MISEEVPHWRYGMSSGEHLVGIWNGICEPAYRRAWKLSVHGWGYGSCLGISYRADGSWTGPYLHYGCGLSIWIYHMVYATLICFCEFCYDTHRCVCRHFL